MVIGIIIGILAGFLASKLTSGQGKGCLLNLILGIVGGAVGGKLFDLLDITAAPTFVGQLVTSVVGASLVLWIWNKIF